MSRFDKHVFVCTNERPAGHLKGSCSACGGNDIKNKLKSLVKQANLKNSIRINSAGCLDACEYGAVIVIYPEETWYGKVGLDDVAEIFQSHLVEGEPVDRLLIPASELAAISTKSTAERFGDRHAGKKSSLPG